MVNFFEALSQILAKAISFFNDIFHTRLYTVYDTIIASVFEAMGYDVDRSSPISGIRPPPENQPPGFFAATISRGARDAWKNLSTVAIEGTDKLLEASMEVVDTVKDKFTELLQPHMDDFTAAILPGSPNDPKLAAITHTIADSFMKSITSIEPKAQSKITYQQARDAAGTYLASNVGMNLFSRGLAAGLDATHPIKKWGVDKIVDGLWWGLGLCWLTWIALGPFLQSYIAKPMARHFRMQFSESDLSRADVLKAYKSGYWDKATAGLKLQYLGYDVEDTIFLLHNAYTEESETEKQLSVTTILKALKLGYISEDDAIQRLTVKGYSDEDIELYIKTTLHEKDESGRELTRSQILRFYREAIITIEDATQQLTTMGYSETEINQMIQLEDLKNYPDRYYLTIAQIGDWYQNYGLTQQEAINYWSFKGISDYEMPYFLEKYKPK